MGKTDGGVERLGETDLLLRKRKRRNIIMMEGERGEKRIAGLCFIFWSFSVQGRCDR